MKHPFVVLLATAVLAAALESIASEPSASRNAFQQRPSLADLAGQPASSGGANSGAKTMGGGDSSFLGKGVPFFDPGNNNVGWDGKSWNVSNNAVFAARFEKYLNAPPATQEAGHEYQAHLRQIMVKLSPGSITPRSSDEAFQLLVKASRYQDDANLCDSIASQVYSAWLARSNVERLKAANRVLEGERKRLEWNAKVTAQGNKFDVGGSARSKDRAFNEIRNQQRLSRDMEMQSLATRLAEINALIRSNQLKREVAELRVKIEFQALIVQHFLQRRFQHVVIGTRFYRSIFADGDGRLQLGKDAGNLFSKTGGLTPTLDTIDSSANEVMSDVRQGVQAFKFLLEKGELESATKRLAEAFTLGEYLPDLRALNRDDKRKVLAVTQKSNQLITSIEVKDFALAEKLVIELTEIARDFDASKPMAAIETAKQVSAMHIAKARNAAVSGDKATLETELKTATEIWPRNPALSEVSEAIFAQALVQCRTMVDFDQLVSQKNYRQIFDDRIRFIAATAMYPKKQDQLREVLGNMQFIETSIIRAKQREKHGDYAGAWESAEKAFRDFPGDNKLNQLRVDLTTKAPAFVRAIRHAEDMEQENQLGSSLAWYLKARDEYPLSEFARQGVDRLTKRILPDAS
jgi:hypothetical protein